MSTDKRFARWAALLAFAVILTYANHFTNDFHFDDFHTIVDNIYIRDIGNVPSFFLDATKSTALPANQAYRPIVTSMTAFEYWLGHGLYPVSFHATIFALFLLQGVLMYFLYLKLFDLALPQERNRYVALVAVGWYMLHPANAETINYILAQSDSISTLFVVLAFVLFLYSARARRQYLYLIPVALGGLTKPTAVMFAPLLLAYVLVYEQQVGLPEIAGTGRTRRTVFALKTTAVAFLFCALLFGFLRHMDSPTWVFGGTSRFRYLITQPFVLLHYFTTFFLPLHLSADTDWTTLTSVLDVRFFIGMLFVILLFLAALVATRQRRYFPIAFGIFWFFLALAPTSTIIPLAEVTNDHRMFYPFVGLTMSVVWALSLLLDKLRSARPETPLFSRAVVIVIVLALTAYAYGTVRRNAVWHTEASLWRDVTLKSPKNPRGLMNYGLALMGKSDYAGAESYFIRALRLAPDYSYLFINLGIVANKTGRLAEAEQYYQKGITADPTNPSCYYFYGLFLRDHGRSREAIWNFRKTLQLAPAHLDARHALLKTYENLHETDKVRKLAEETLRIAPNDRIAAAALAATGPRGGE